MRGHLEPEHDLLELELLLGRLAGQERVAWLGPEQQPRVVETNRHSLGVGQRRG
jgi:hypothetical protein